ncbi:MAG: lytic transglycosylase domain-containing protein [Mariprofundaceae bacterium]|nr:lytic transglycosylase domain-containing protein [Mariprofundaceae bacterium]
MSIKINMHGHDVSPHSAGVTRKSGNHPMSSFDTVFKGILNNGDFHKNFDLKRLNPQYVNSLTKVVLMQLDRVSYLRLAGDGSTVYSPSANGLLQSMLALSASASYRNEQIPAPLQQAAQKISRSSDFPFSDIIQKASKIYHLDAKLIGAVIQAESNFDEKAVSESGAQGLMQLMPETAKDMKVEDPFDPVQNIMGGSRYLKQLLHRYDGRLELALAAYNWGMGNLERQPDKLPEETRNYIAKVTTLLNGST